MKKLGKLNISPDKVMKNEELLNLRGGYEVDNYVWMKCICTNRPNPPFTGRWCEKYDKNDLGQIMSDAGRYCEDGQANCTKGCL